MNITIKQALDMSKEGMYFKVADGKIRGFIIDKSEGEE